jgi:hypothetical protein
MHADAMARKEQRAIIGSMKEKTKDGSENNNGRRNGVENERISGQ